MHHTLYLMEINSASAEHRLLPCKQAVGKDVQITSAHVLCTSLRRRQSMGCGHRSHDNDSETKAPNHMTFLLHLRPYSFNYSLVSIPRMLCSYLELKWIPALEYTQPHAHSYNICSQFRHSAQDETQKCGCLYTVQAFPPFNSPHHLHGNGFPNAYSKMVVFVLWEMCISKNNWSLPTVYLLPSLQASAFTTIQCHTTTENEIE